MKCYVTFGQVHNHNVNGKAFDKDTVAIIKGGSYDACREKAFEVFGREFCFITPENRWSTDKMRYYPKGYVALED